ncbi:hypothetical protein Tco_0658643 [Tanacetum coccineum]
MTEPSGGGMDDRHEREGTPPPLTKEQIEGHISGIKFIIKDYNRQNNADPIRLDFGTDNILLKEGRVARGKEVGKEDLSKPFKEPLTRRIIEFTGPKYIMPTNNHLWTVETGPRVFRMSLKIHTSWDPIISPDLAKRLLKQHNPKSFNEMMRRVDEFVRSEKKRCPQQELPPRESRTFTSLSFRQTRDVHQRFTFPTSKRNDKDNRRKLNHLMKDLSKSRKGSRQNPPPPPKKLKWKVICEAGVVDRVHPWKSCLNIVLKPCLLRHDWGASIDQIDTPQCKSVFITVLPEKRGANLFPRKKSEADINECSRIEYEALLAGLRIAKKAEGVKHRAEGDTFKKGYFSPDVETHGAQLVNEPLKGGAPDSKIQQMNTSVPTHKQRFMERANKATWKNQDQSRKGNKMPVWVDEATKCAKVLTETQFKQSNGETPSVNLWNEKRTSRPR